MLQLSLSGFLLEEHFSQKGRTSKDACFNKPLTLDISHQSHQPMALISVDAAQYYNWVNCSIMALVWMALKLPFHAVSMMFSCLGYMKIFTRTGFGDSTTSFGGQSRDIPFCGLGQGSKGAPASWVQLSSIIVSCHKKHGFGAQVRDPISGEVSRSIGCLFVDDTNLYCMEEGRLDSVEEIHREAQSAFVFFSFCGVQAERSKVQKAFGV